MSQDKINNCCRCLAYTGISVILLGRCSTSSTCWMWQVLTHGHCFQRGNVAGCIAFIQSRPTNHIIIAAISGGCSVSSTVAIMPLLGRCSTGSSGLTLSRFGRLLHQLHLMKAVAGSWFSACTCWGFARPADCVRLWHMAIAYTSPKYHHISFVLCAIPANTKINPQKVKFSICIKIMWVRWYGFSFFIYSARGDTNKIQQYCIKILYCMLLVTSCVVTQ